MIENVRDGVDGLEGRRVGEVTVCDLVSHLHFPPYAPIHKLLIMNASSHIVNPPGDQNDSRSQLRIS